MKKFIVLIIFLISNFSFYGVVNDNGKKVTDLQETMQIQNEVQNENITTEEIATQEIMAESNDENAEENVEIKENTVEEKIQNSTKKEITETQKNVETSSITNNANVNSKSTETKTDTNKAVTTTQPQQQTQTKDTVKEEQKPVVNQVKETKYLKNDQMIEKIRQTIKANETEDMKTYGYQIVVDSSIKANTNQFTFTENIVKSSIKNAFGTIKIYAEDYYSNGQLIMTECYIL